MNAPCVRAGDRFERVRRDGAREPGTYAVVGPYVDPHGRGAGWVISGGTAPDGDWGAPRWELEELLLDPAAYRRVP